jgi:hypothetical protein
MPIGLMMGGSGEEQGADSFTHNENAKSTSHHVSPQSEHGGRR